jgi:hypothetical protein
MDEVLPGVLHWTTFHEGIGQPVHSHFFVEGAALFDPRVPDEGGVQEVARHGRAEVVLLSNRHHLRHAEQFAEAFGCPIRAQRSGLHEFTDGPDVQAFDFGDELAPGVRALEVGALTPEDTAFHRAAGGGILLFADALVRDDDGALSFVSDGLMGDDPEAVRVGLTAALDRLLEETFDAMLFAHGAPIAEGAKARLAAFVRDQQRAR